MQIKTFTDYQSLSRECANLVASYIRRKPASVICLASGSTPIGVFHCLVEDVRSGKLDLSQCLFVSLDEWVGIDKTVEGSCRNMMDKDLFHPLNIPESNICFFDGMAADLPGECKRINQFIESHGGLDIMLVGIGMNGHIAMNEPGTSPHLYAHISDLAEETKVVGQKYFATKTRLSKGLTLGLRHLKESRLPILMANGSKKASIIQKVLKQAPSPDLPASVVQHIPDCIVLLDKEAAALLEP